MGEDPGSEARETARFAQHFRSPLSLSCVYWQLTLADTGFGITGIQRRRNHCHQMELCDRVQRAVLPSAQGTCVTLCDVPGASPAWLLPAMSLCVKVPGAWGSPGSDRLQASPHLHPVLQGNSQAPRCW